MDRHYEADGVRIYEVDGDGCEITGSADELICACGYLKSDSAAGAYHPVTAECVPVDEDRAACERVAEKLAAAWNADPGNP